MPSLPGALANPDYFFVCLVQVIALVQPSGLSVDGSSYAVMSQTLVFGADDGKFAITEKGESHKIEKY